MDFDYSYKVSFSATQFFCHNFKHRCSGTQSPIHSWPALQKSSCFYDVDVLLHWAAAAACWSHRFSDVSFICCNTKHFKSADKARYISHEAGDITDGSTHTQSGYSHSSEEHEETST